MEEGSRDTRYTHSVLNYIHASYQGRFAHLNILNQLEPNPDLSPQIQEVRDVLAFCSEKLDLLWEGQPLFSLQWPAPQTTESLQCYQLLQGVISELAQVALDLRALLVEGKFDKIPLSKIFFMIASFGRFAYTRDNFCRGILELSEFLQDQTSIDATKTLLPASDDNIRVAHAFLKTGRNPQQIPAHFFSALFAECATLPGEFRCQAHDILQLVSVYSGDFTFERAGIDLAERSAWKELGIGPAEAGYWLAYSIPAQEALAWNQKGFTSFRSAGLWRSWFFPPEAASDWLKQGFTPQEAAAWANQGYDPQQAKQFVQKGITDPAAAQAKK